MRYLIIFFLFICTYQMGLAQDFKDLDESPMDVSVIRNTDNSPLARIIYSRPRKKDREIFGALVPFNQVWRTGANESTEITLYEELYINGICLDPGTYSLYTIPGPKIWTVIFNEAQNAWGAFNYNEKLDALRVKVPAQRAASIIEVFSIAFQPAQNGINLFIGWDDTFIKIPFKKTLD
ncbi:DUF2911 domain-containing protein [Mesonia sediminis]|uniref:DUF2911 domain-containing protein n=1 Tax=Mesonia sediminis TaxID=1703946 RepID=A0ABW5SBR9_9FLAO